MACLTVHKSDEEACIDLLLVLNLLLVCSKTAARDAIRARAFPLLISLLEKHRSSSALTWECCVLMSALSSTDAKEAARAGCSAASTAAIAAHARAAEPALCTLCNITAAEECSEN